MIGAPLPPNTFRPDSPRLPLVDDGDDVPCEGCGVLRPQPLNRLPGALPLDGAIVMIGIPDQDGDPARN
jgi:hypothetical protein